LAIATARPASFAHPYPDSGIPFIRARSPFRTKTARRVRWPPIRQRLWGVHPLSLVRGIRDLRLDPNHYPRPRSTPTPSNRRHLRRETN